MGKETEDDVGDDQFVMSKRGAPRLQFEVKREDN